MLSCNVLYRVAQRIPRSIALCALCAVTVALARCVQEKYLNDYYLVELEYEAQAQDCSEQAAALSQERRPHGDADWIRRRRQNRALLEKSWHNRRVSTRALEEEVAKGVKALSQDCKVDTDLLDMPDWLQELMQRYQQRLQEPDEPTLTLSNAGQRIRTWWAEQIGRTVYEGPGGTTAPEPGLEPRQQTWGMHEWAEWWLEMAGFQEAQEFDNDGWTALHHACQAMAYWGKAYLVVEGLVHRMSPWWLCAKTWGGKPSGWSALHMLANGSDKCLQGGRLVVLLLHWNAEVDSEDWTGRTPLHLAVGTGVTDVARTLVQWNADFWKTSHDNRNIADRCGTGEGMRWCPSELYSTVSTLSKYSTRSPQVSTIGQRDAGPVQHCAPMSTSGTWQASPSLGDGGCGDGAPLSISRA